jgi:hypothetical protein
VGSGLVIGWPLNYSTLSRTKNGRSSWALIHCHRAKITHLCCHFGPSTTELVAQSEAPLPSYSSSKAIPVQVWTAPEDSRSWGFQISRHITHESGNVRHTHRPPLPRKYSWYSFLLEAGSTPGSQCGRKDYINKKFKCHHRESNPRPSACSAVLQPTNLSFILLCFSTMMILNVNHIWGN